MGKIKLKQMSFGDILDYTISIYKDNFLKLFIAVGILSFPLTIMSNIVATPISSSKVLNMLKNSLNSDNSVNYQSLADEMKKISLEQSGRNTTIIAIIGILIFIASCIYVPAIYRIIHGYVMGKDVDVKQSYKYSFKRMFNYVGLKILTGLIMIAIYIGVVIALVIFGIIGALLVNLLKASTVLGVILIVILGIFAVVLFAVLYAYIMAFSYFSTASFVIEENGVMESIGRGFSLASFKIFRYLGAGILMGLIIAIPTFILSMVGGAIGVAVGSDMVTYVITTIVGIIFTPIMYILFAVLLYDYKVRKEGFDLNQEFNDLVNNEG